MTSAYVDRGIAYGRKNQYDRAIADFDRAIQLNPQLKGIHSNRGLAYVNKRDYDRAIADLDSEIQLNPEDAFVYHNRGTPIQ